MRMSTLALLVGLLAFPLSTASAQQGVSSIRGRVVDSQGGVLPGVTVLITHQESGNFRQVSSNVDGTYFVTGIVPGAYRVEAELPGFKKYTRERVLLEVGSTMTLEVVLDVGALEETVTVTGDSPLVDLTSSQVGGNVSERELTELPNATRNWLGFVGLLPGIQVQSTTISFGGDTINVNGQSSRNNNFTVDGGGNNDDYYGQAFGGQTRTALEAVQEFQVLTNQFDAEFGRTTGAVVNAVTKQGTNRFRGSVFGYFADSALTARDFLAEQQDLSKPDTKKKEWGGTIGGPIIRNKAHFFYSLERVAIDDGRSNVFAARPELNYSIPQQTRVWNHMVRFDHQLNAKHSWGVRYLAERSPTLNQVSGIWTLDALREETDLDQTTVGTWNSLFGNNKFNTVRIAVTKENNAFASTPFNNGTAQVDLLPTLEMLTFRDQQYPGADRNRNNSYEFNDTFSWFLPARGGGEHELKVGTQALYADIRLDNEGNRNGSFFFNTDRVFNAADPTTYPERLSILVPAGDSTLMTSKVLVLFAQDRLRRGSLTLNLGIRYDLEILPLSAQYNPLFTDGRYPVDKNNISPRLGVAWNVGGTGRTVVRGGYGRFFEKTHFQIVQAFERSRVYSSSFTARFPVDRVDPGPSSGNFPTDPLLSRGPVVNHDLIRQLYPPGSLARNTGVVYLDNPDRVVPSTHQFTGGFERQLGTQFSASADFVHSRSVDLLVTYNVNPAVRVNTSRTGALIYTDLYGLAGQLGISPFVNQVLTRRNDGDGTYDGLNLQLEKRYGNNWGARVSYSIGYSRGSTGNSGTDMNLFQLLDDPRLSLNEGPTDTDRRHNFVLSGRMEVPKTGGLTISGVYRYLSGAPLTIEDQNFDVDQNGELFDPLPAGNYCGQGLNSICVDSEGGRNGAIGPNFHQADVRLGYRFKAWQEATIDTYVDIFNVFNTANFVNPIGDRRQSNFLILQSLRGGGFPRQAQIGVRLGF